MSSIIPPSRLRRQGAKYSPPSSPRLRHQGSIIQQSHSPSPSGLRRQESIILQLEKESNDYIQYLVKMRDKIKNTKDRRYDDYQLSLNSIKEVIK